MWKIKQLDWPVITYNLVILTKNEDKEDDDSKAEENVREFLDQVWGLLAHSKLQITRL